MFFIGILQEMSNWSIVIYPPSIYRFWFDG